MRAAACKRSRDTLAENPEVVATLKQAILAAGPIKPGRRAAAAA